MKKVVLASHGDLAKGMLNSITMIVGNLAEDIQVFCLYPGQNANDYMKQMKCVIEEDQHNEYVFLCDLKGGSVHTALSQLCMFQNVKVFSGMNMNLVLDILLSSSNEIEEGVEDKFIVGAREGITLTIKKNIITDEDDDF